jgi:glycosyltransferase involved in cell wall biosynthesis
VSYLFHEAFMTPFSNLERILNCLSSESSVIVCGLDQIFNKINREKSYQIYHRKYSNLLLRIISFIISQISISIKMISIKSRIDIYIFFMDGGIILPIFTAKLLGKKTLWLLPSSFLKMEKHNRDLLSHLLAYTQALSYKIVDKIVIYSPYLINEFGLNEFCDKILIAHEHILDSQEFRIHKPLRNRSTLVGYIGRLSNEKGVMNFVKAIPEILRERKDIDFLIGGDGPLRQEVLGFIEKNNIGKSVKFTGWISRDDLPKYLNEMKLFVLPSYTEGLPNMLLEAMVSCTPVLAANVGAIPSVIKEGETGFIMKDNSPNCIAIDIIRALENPDLDGVAQRAEILIKREFSFEMTVQCWKSVLKNV